MSTSPLNCSILRNEGGSDGLALTKEDSSPPPAPSSSSNNTSSSGGGQCLEDVSVHHSTTLSCFFCKSLLKDARVLPCLHSFCKICLKTHWKKSNNQGGANCPICKVPVDLNGSIENLPMNTYYNNFTGLVDSADSATESDFERLSLRNGMTGKSGGGGAGGDVLTNPTPTSSAGGSRGTSPPTTMEPRRRSGNGWTAAVTPPRSKPTHHSTDSWPIKSKGSNNSGTPNGSLENNAIWKSHFNFPQFVKINGETNHPAASSIPPPPAGASVPASGINDSQGWQPLGNNGTNVSDSVWSPPRTTPCGKPLCSCADKNPVTSRCRDCAEDLCDSCVDAHQRVKLTRDHVIVRYPNDNVPSSAVTGNGGGGELAAANTLPVTPPVIPKADVMRVYVDAVGKAKADSEKYLTKAKQGMAQIEETKLLVANMITRVESRYQTVIHEVKAITQRHIAALQEREKILLIRLDKIRQVKFNALKSQKDELNMSTLYLGEVAKQLTCCSQSGREMDLIDSCNSAIETIRKVQNQCGTLSVQEDDVFEYTPPEPAILQSIMNYGFIGSSGYAPACRAEGDGLKRAILGKEARFIVVVKDHLNEQRVTGGDPLKVTILAPDSRPVRQTIVDGKNGTYRVQWKPNVEGEHIVAITLKDKHIQDSPFTVHIRSGRNYNNIGQQLFEFGGEGEGPGELCRPWGIACTKDGNIMVANRSNNRIEVYNKDGKPLYNFGVPGKLRGQFDRPASVVCDRMNRAVIADKDNHRIQVFTIDGEFLMMFGEKGSKNGQFNYPWDVATNSKDQILVSDTRNHRIQLFSPNGDFLAKYGFEGAMWKHFDSPRGVAFTADDQAVVTDFNNHRLLVVKADFNIAQFLGKEGSEDGMFTRPNGVCVDEEGHIIVADSRNDRIQIFSSSGVFVKKFGCKGTNPGEFDRPSGICISPDGKLIVVDFGNNRVQVF